MSQKIAVIYGGSGALGSALVNAFSKNKYSVISVDFRKNEIASTNIVLESGSLETQHEKVLQEIKAVLKSDDKISAIVNAAGGWAGGSAADAKEFLNATELMWKQSVHSSVISARIAAEFLKNDGLVGLVGAKPALHGTGFMLGYGMAKAAVHQLAKSLATSSSGLPKESSVVCVLPVTLDTPGNRKGMPNADTSTWTSCDELANKFLSWSDKSEATPKSGSLVEVITKDGKTSFTALEA